jgi:hypothetical protein
MATRLKVLLRERHWQTYPAFCREYDQVAAHVDPLLVGRRPRRAQIHHWMAGDRRGRPHPDHCQVLEAMFPGWTVDQLLAEPPPDQPVN